MGQQVFAVPAVRELEESGGLQVHALAYGRRVEVFVAADSDIHELMARAGDDQKIDGGLVVGYALLLELHLGVEVPLRLEIVAQVARALHQQVVIHRVFLEHRHVAPQLPLGELGAHRVEHDSRAGIDTDGGNGAIRSRVVADGFQRDLGFQPVFVLVQRADAVQALAEARLGNRLPGVDHPAAEFQGGENLRGIHLEIARQDGRAEAGAGPALHVEADVHLLEAGAGQEVESGPDLGGVQAVASEQPPLAGHGLLDEGVGEGSAQVETRRVLELPGVGRGGDMAYRRNVPHEPTVPGEEDDGDAVRGRPRIHLDIRVAAGGEEALDGRAHLGYAQRLPRF